MQDSKDRRLSVNEAAEALGVSPQCVRLLIASGEYGELGFYRVSPGCKKKSYFIYASGVEAFKKHGNINQRITNL